VEAQFSQTYEYGELGGEGIDVGPSTNPRIQELRNQLREEQNRCRDLQLKVEEKNNYIQELEAIRADTLEHELEANETNASEWRLKYERTMGALRRTENERKELREQLEEAEEKIGELSRELRKARFKIEEKDDEIAHLKRKNERQMSEHDDDIAGLRRQLAAITQISPSSQTSPNLSFHNSSTAPNQEIRSATTPATSFTLPTAQIVDDRSGLILVDEDGIGPRASLTHSGNQTAEEVSPCCQSDAHSCIELPTQTPPRKPQKEKRPSQTNQALNFLSGTTCFTVRNGRIVSGTKGVVFERA
jgi:hypothetical protein